MFRVILTILIVSTLLKVVSFSSVFENACKCELVKLSEADEDCAGKKGGTEDSKYDNDDKLHLYHAVNSSRWYIMGKSLSSCTHQKPYLRFVDKPNTPPPDLV